MEISPATTSYDSQIRSSNSDEASSNDVPNEEMREEREFAGNFPATSSTSSVSVKNMYDDDDDEEDVCRICRNPGDADNPLRYPCACSGSIKFVHQDCLLQWLNHSNARQCEV